MATEAEAIQKLNFIEKVLPKLIVERNEDFQDYEVINCRAELNKHLDGFMSAIYDVELTMRAKGEKDPTTHKIILKIMKGDENFRELAKSNVMFANEVLIYKTIVPFFKKYLKDNNVTIFNSDKWWTPRVYFADCGIFPELSESSESILALENLKASGFRMGPKIDLDENHLKLMIKNIAYYHSVSYALRIRKDQKLKEFETQIAPFSFLSETGEELGSYKRLFEVGLQRFYNLVENDSRYQYSEEFVGNVKKFKEKYGTNPLVLMESFLKKDETFSIVLHGDYVRNNVMFKYDQSEGFEDPKAIKMYDFQENRFATPVIDIAFFLYMNLHYTKREELWDSLVSLYHDTLTKSLIDILKCDKNDERLKPYSYENFLDHFAKNAFYGVIICLHYVPWIACPESECSQIAHWFETDMNGEEFFKITQISGGEDVDKRIVSIVKHASDKGYMKYAI